MMRWMLVNYSFHEGLLTNASIASIGDRLFFPRPFFEKRIGLSNLLFLQSAGGAQARRLFVIIHRPRKIVVARSLVARARFSLHTVCSSSLLVIASTCTHNTTYF
jgi:hypothetical protein